MKSQSNKWLALDAYKAMSVFSMILWHLVVWWFGHDNINIRPLEGAANLGRFHVGAFSGTILILSGFFTMSIPATAGAVFRFYYKNLNKNKERIALNKSLYYVLGIAISFLLLGFIINLLAWGPSYFFDWNVLQFISLCLIIVAVILKFLQLYYLMAFSIIVLLLAPVLRTHLADTSSYLIKILIGDSLGYNLWPFFPWFFIFVYGFAVAHFYIKCTNSRNTKYFRSALIFAGLIFTGVGAYYGKFFFFIEKGNVWGPGLFQPPTLTILALLGVFNITIAVIDFYFSRFGKINKYGIINSYSRGILWIYIILFVIGYRLVIFVRNVLPNGLFPFLLLIALLLLISWVVGLLTIKIYEKRLFIELRKIKS
ncbi:MAG: heparan-alpha-glucosaminide N-acetyltransferase domain-containing protein [Nanoarchaeota archaeon]|nr:heparan-alpha-glucosaminide N-acetyltransferase domain-containing protein [Nanoarchaeota archaeon]